MQFSAVQSMLWTLRPGSDFGALHACSFILNIACLNSISMNQAHKMRYHKYLSLLNAGIHAGFGSNNSLYFLQNCIIAIYISRLLSNLPSLATVWLSSFISLFFLVCTVNTLSCAVFSLSLVQLLVQHTYILVVLTAQCLERRSFPNSS